MTFQCIVEADLARETTLYSGTSAARALEYKGAAMQMARLFKLEALIKIVRFKRRGGSIPVLSRTVFRNGECASHKEVQVSHWHADLTSEDVKAIYGETTCGS